MAFKGSKYEAGKNFGDSFIAQVNKRVKTTWSKFIEDFKVSIKTWEIKILSFEQRPLIEIFYNAWDQKNQVPHQSPLVQHLSLAHNH